MILQQMKARIVCHGELSPCRTAFIDAHTRGAARNPSLTGFAGGVSEATQLRNGETAGSYMGAVGQRPFCHNALDLHRTGPAVRVLKGHRGTAGGVMLDKRRRFRISNTYDHADPASRR
jgi:hypothetical protein